MSTRSRHPSRLVVSPAAVRLPLRERCGSEREKNLRPTTSGPASRKKQSGGKNLAGPVDRAFGDRVSIFFTPSSLQRTPKCSERTRRRRFLKLSVSCEVGSSEGVTVPHRFDLRNRRKTHARRKRGGLFVNRRLDVVPSTAGRLDRQHSWPVAVVATPERHRAGRRWIPKAKRLTAVPPGLTWHGGVCSTIPLGCGLTEQVGQLVYRERRTGCLFLSHPPPGSPGFGVVRPGGAPFAPSPFHSAAKSIRFSDGCLPSHFANAVEGARKLTCLDCLASTIMQSVVIFVNRHMSVAGRFGNLRYRMVTRIVASERAISV